jgi:hypothetical protein
MRLLLGLLSYLIAAVAIVSGAAAFLSSAVEPGTRTVPAQRETPKVAPGVQAWLDRKAEGLVYYAEKEKSASFAEKERGLRTNVSPQTEQAAPAQARETAERESATRARQSAKREARRRSRQLEQTEARAAYGYVPEPARSSGPRLHAPE